MSNAPCTLAELQAWLQQAITHPHGMHAGADDAEIAVVVSASARQSARERLEIYHRAYFARLIEVLRETFPLLVGALGEETFGGLALAYLEQHPPRSYTLNRLGDRFEEFLRTTRPPRADEGMLDWADFLIDLARFETAIDEVFDGPGSEGQPALDPQVLVTLAADVGGALRLQLAPSVRLLAFDFPLNDYFTAVRGGAAAPLPRPAASWLALYRRDYVVQRLPLSEAEHAVLSTIAQDASLGDAIAAAVPLVDAPSLPDKLQAWFRDWSAAGLLSVARSSG